jgi:hypothetical protein
LINFRFHLVSLVAIFLALGVGLIVGSTVIDQATVQGLERNVDALRSQRTSAREERDEARQALSHWEDFDGELPAELLAGRLADVPVLLVAIEGVDTEVTDRLARWFATAGAHDLGTLTLTAKLSLASDDDRRDLAELLDVGPGRRESVQRAALDAIADALNPPVEDLAPAPPPPAATTTTSAPVAPGGSEVLGRLRDAGFLRFDPPEGVDADVTSVPAPGMRVALVSAADVELANTAVAAPLAALLADQPGVSLVAADATPVTEGGPAFAALIRADGELRRRVASVDDVSEGYGQVALVLALEDLAGGVVGHYGIAGDQLLPAPNR